MTTNKLTEDLKKLANAQVFIPLTKQLNVYEKKARGLIKEFDLRSREARDKSRARLDDFLVQLKKTRTEVESKVRSLYEEESKRINARVNDLLETIRTVAQPDSAPTKAAAPKAKTATRKKTGTKKTAKKRASTNDAHTTTAH